MDMLNVNFGGDGYFSGKPLNSSNGVSVDGFGMVPEKTVQLDGFATILSGKSSSKGIDFDALAENATQDALNSEAAFSTNQIIGNNDESLLVKLESLEDIDSLLKRVGELLGLHIDMEKSLNNIDPENIPDEIVSQLMDFLNGLKEFSVLLQKTGEAGVSIEIAGEEIVGEEVLDVARSLNSEVLKLEVSCTKLDISGRMAIMSAIQNKQPIPSGVQFAVNPKDLAGTQKIPQSIAALFTKEESELEGIIKSIRLLAASEGKASSMKSLAALAGKPDSAKGVLSIPVFSGDNGKVQVEGSAVGALTSIEKNVLATGLAEMVASAEGTKGSVPVDSAKLAVPAEGVKLAVPADSAKLAVPAESAKLAVPADSAKLAVPAEGAKLAVPVEGVKLAVPVEGVKLAVPVEGVKLAVPAEGVKLAVPAEGVKLAVPSDSVKLAVPAESVKLAVPADSAKLAVPAEGVKLAVPAESAKFAVPSDSVKLAAPSESAKLAIHAEGVKLAVPVESVKLAVPAESVKLAVPAEGAKLAVPAEGAKLAVPAEGVMVEVLAESVKLAVPVEGVKLAVSSEGVKLAVPSESVKLAVPAEGVKLAVPAEGVKLAVPAESATPTGITNTTDISEEMVEQIGDAMIAQSEASGSEQSDESIGDSTTIIASSPSENQSEEFAGEEDSDVPGNQKPVVSNVKVPEENDVREPIITKEKTQVSEPLSEKMPDSAKVMLAELTAAVAKIDTKTVSVESVSVVGEDGTISVMTETVTQVNEMAVTVEQQRISTDDSAPVFKVEKPHAARTFEQVVVDQVRSKLTEAVKNGSREVTLILKPEMLGEVKITIQITGDVVSAKLQVENQQVKNLVENNLQNLRDSLAAQSLTAGSLDVNVGHGESRSADAKKSGRRKAGIADSVESFENDPFVPDLFGKETGRRYGNNSVEYFA